MKQEYQGDIHFVTDAWTSGNHKLFVAITAHIILEGQPTTILLDFLELAKSHMGITLAQEFAKVLKAFGIGNKILCIMGDNATNNEAMIDHLSLLLKTYPGQKHHDELELDEVEVKTLRQELAKFEKDKKSRKKSNKVEDDVEEEEVLDAKSLLNDFETVDLETEIAPIQQALLKICTISFKVIHSITKLLPAWCALLTERGLPIRIIPRDVRTRWNLTFTMLEFALAYRDAINALTSDVENNFLKDTLKVLKQATDLFSSRSPTVTDVIPVIDKIDRFFASCIVETCTKAGVTRIQVSEALKTTSSVYRIAMVLDPPQKLEYFKAQGWERAWIDEAEKIANEC
ncbi:hypothetical protein VNI00_006166 [Paramarasmius palmivorus]|uniref:Uncharacterized protein n=1 Tax=Paramarasmius palmivorus TaxID=297713 RepID=A0AAW0D964_9AGAR